MKPALLHSYIAGLKAREGKVREMYDFGDRLLIVATDRISAFDWVMPNGIPDKGRVLSKLSEMWFRKLNTPNHLLSMDIADVPLPTDTNRRQELVGRSMVVRKTQVFPVECVVRGYLSGSGWKEYRQIGAVCGIALPTGLRESDQLPEPIFTPATKEETGHDINIPFARMVEIVGSAAGEELRRRSLAIYHTAAEYARTKGIIIADTKFEFGKVITDGKVTEEIILIDEVLTPDSSRFWPKDQYEPGHGQPSFDKQFVRDWLETTDWDKNSPPPRLPDHIVEQTRDKYLEGYRMLVGSPLDVA